MLKKTILLILMPGLLFSCNKYDQVQTEELQAILSDVSTSSVFISVDIKCGNEKFPIIIENGSFYDMLFQMRKVENKGDYVIKMTQRIIKKQTIHFSIEDKDMIKSYSVTFNDSIRDLLKEDKEEFIDKYFENNWLKSEDISFIQEKAILYYLFKNRIYCKSDCVSGYIFIVSEIDNNN